MSWFDPRGRDGDRVAKTGLSTEAMRWNTVREGGKTNGERITDECVQGEGGTRHRRMARLHGKCGVKVSLRGGVRRMAAVSGGLIKSNVPREQCRRCCTRAVSGDYPRRVCNVLDAELISARERRKEHPGRCPRSRRRAQRAATGARSASIVAAEGDGDDEGGGN